MAAQADDFVIEVGIEGGEPGTEEATDPTILVVSGSGDTAMLLEIDRLTGEILRDECAPLETASAEAVAAYLGPRLVAANAELQGLLAEKAAWTKRINEQYDSRINDAKRRVTWLSSGAGFRETLKAFASKALARAKTRTLPLSLLTLSFRKKAARVEIASESVAVNFCKRFFPDAVKVEESVLISLVPKTYKDSWITGEVPLPDEAGMRIVPEDDLFEIK